MQIRFEITYSSGRVEIKTLSLAEAKKYEDKLKKLPTILNIKKEKVK